MATAALNLFPVRASTSSSHTSTNTPRLSFYSHFIRSTTTFPSISLKLTNPKRLSSLTIVSAVKKLSELDVVTVPSESNEFSGKFPADSGVYAVYDSSNELQFIGVSRNIAASVLSHRNSVPELCSSVKVWKQNHILTLKLTCQCHVVLDPVEYARLQVIFVLSHLYHFYKPASSCNPYKLPVAWSWSISQIFTATPINGL